MSHLVFAALALCVVSANSKNVIEMSMLDNTKDDPALLNIPKQFSFAAYYGDHMVLQKAPQQAVIWGYNPLSNVFIDVSVAQQKVRALVGTNGQWSVTLDPVKGSGPYNVTARGPEGEITLTDVLFGDVWLCSGQSNMQFSVSQVFNASEEIKDADNYPNIRLFTVNQVTSKVPLTDLDAPKSIKQPWSVASRKAVDGGAWGYFSAVCWLYGKYLYQKLGYPIGLVNTCWGGTPVEAWSSPDALAKCGLDSETIASDLMMEPFYGRISPDGNFGGPQNSMVLWNAMIHPLLDMTIYGAIWYQGENNAHLNRHLYNCTFPSMISDWRVKFHASHGQNDPTFPFGFVMLGANTPNMSDFDGFPEIRWHQTADFGFVPNKKMENVFMANAMDLPDFLSPFGPIHPRDKQGIARRLVNASLAVAYHHTDIPYQAPLPSGFKVNTAASTLEIIFSNGTDTLELRNNVGFEVCCSYGSEGVCDSRAWWLQAPIVRKTESSVIITTASCEPQNVAGTRYAWRLSPCTFMDCSVYSLHSSLPASPFQFTAAEFHKDGSYYVDKDIPYPLEG